MPNFVTRIRYFTTCATDDIYPALKICMPVWCPHPSYKEKYIKTKIHTTASSYRIENYQDEGIPQKQMLMRQIGKKHYTIFSVAFSFQSLYECIL